MMKKLLFLMAIVALSTNLSTAQYAEVAPYGVNPSVNIPDNTNALFDVEFTYDLAAAVGANGNAGVVFFNGQFWVSSWNSDQIHVIEPDGTYLESFAISGISGTRSFTTDGTSIFIGTAGNQIFEVDPLTRELIGAINISPSTDAKARMVTYDSTLDGGNGGFWVGNFSSDIASFDMDGNELSVIPLATHNTVIYGGAVDYVSPDGPFLWIFQVGNQTNPNATITQLSLPDGAPTGVSFDAQTISPGSGAGLFISEDVITDEVTIIGVLQSDPNILFGIELLGGSAGVNDNSISNFSLYPNPANGKVNINTSVAGEKQVVVYNVLGERVINKTIQGNELNITSLKTGVYLVNVTQNKVTATKKLVVQ